MTATSTPLPERDEHGDPHADRDRNRRRRRDDGHPDRDADRDADRDRTVTPTSTDWHRDRDADGHRHGDGDRDSDPQRDGDAGRDGLRRAADARLPAARCVPTAASSRSRTASPTPTTALDWRWSRGPRTPKADFGDPLGTHRVSASASMTATSTRALNLEAPAGGICDVKTEEGLLGGEEARLLVTVKTNPLANGSEPRAARRTPR